MAIPPAKLVFILSMLLPLAVILDVKCDLASYTGDRNYSSRSKRLIQRLERLNVRSLPTLGSLDYIELHSLALLKALETV